MTMVDPFKVAPGFDDLPVEDLGEGITLDSIYPPEEIAEFRAHDHHRATADQVEAFVRKHNGKSNLYYSVNPTRTPLNKKAAKTDIAAIEYIPTDLDPHEGETSEAAKARYLKAL